MDNEGVGLFIDFILWIRMSPPPAPQRKSNNIVTFANNGRINRSMIRALVSDLSFVHRSPVALSRLGGFLEDCPLENGVGHRAWPSESTPSR
jgi:hypothetical protein